jgi:putative nucleotidyltransferase with HDIG domain
MKIARPIHDKNGRTLLNAGIILTESSIKSLSENGISYLYIESPFINDIKISDDISLELRNKTAKKVMSILNDNKKGDHKLNLIMKNQTIWEIKLVLELLLTEMIEKKEILSLLTHLQTNDEYLFEHSLNVMLYSLAIAKRMDFNDKDMYLLGLGAMLHDIGKVFISPEILNKKGKLSDEEYREIQKHTEYGFEFLKEKEIPLLVAQCAHQHHEKLDGTGYPRGLKSNEIHLFAKVIAVADVFDALTSHRCYRKAMLPYKAMEILIDGCGTHFDGKVLDAFNHVVDL